MSAAAPTARPLRLVGAQALRAIELRLLSALLPWAQDWLPAPAAEPTLRLQAVPRGALPAGRHELHANQSGRVWFRHAEADARALATALLGAPPARHANDAVFDAALADARRARNRAIAELLIGPHDDPVEAPLDPALAAFGSGALQIEGEAIGLAAFADEGVLRHVPPLEGARAALPRLVPLEQTLHRAPLQLEVTLGSVELELGPLLGLGVGDVIRLPTRLDELLAVSAGGHRLAGGRPGEHRGQRAVQLLK